MNFWDSVGGYNFAHQLISVLKDIASELKTANELKKKEMEEKQGCVSYSENSTENQKKS